MSEYFTPEDMIEALHAEHVREFEWMQGTALSDPVLAFECGNCQRWGRYAVAVLSDIVNMAKAQAWSAGAHAAMTEVRALLAHWDEHLARSQCPSCLSMGGCDHQEGYHHAYSDLQAVLEGRLPNPHEQPPPTPRTPEEKRAFSQAWDARVAEGKKATP